MAILIDENTRVLVQGITGREGRVRTKLMKEYGTCLVGGVTPGRGGEEVEGVPVFDSVEEAIETQGPVDVSVIFVPASLVKEAALEGLAAGIKMCVLIPDRVPIYDLLEILEMAASKRAHCLGPNTLGLVSPGKALVGMIGGRAERARQWFRSGPVGVCSRSGGMTSAISYYLTEAGLGQSSIVHVGGDAVVGLGHPEIVAIFENDPQTEIITLFGEIGTTQEERVADLVKQGKITKPIVAYLGGKAAKSGTRFSHAGAIIEGGRGSYETKKRCLEEAGVKVVDSIFDFPREVKKRLKTI
ncbi:MAG: succinate--CoA ligase subunit alpha [Candidatus Aminicenantes bacterium 4484_214]|nr:MAG: succinate--CoA ligase subunit alpha [Candidatus Aminicenantes bacterium 4484_214]HDJ24046.1 succinate--CoA ligase subunit alpha [Candidatus Aminicenantes bacterium]